MALDLAGIRNLDFYSPHYLEAVLESDLKSVFKKWKEAKDEKGTQQPQERLNKLANPYFAAVSKAESERDPVRRWEIAREFHVKLLEALDYPYQRDAALLEDNSVVRAEREGSEFTIEMTFASGCPLIGNATCAGPGWTYRFRG